MFLPHVRLKMWNPTSHVLLALVKALSGESYTRAVGPTAPDAAPDRPEVVGVTPPNGATDVNPVTEIHICFNHPMDPTRIGLEWERGDAGFRIRGEIRYSADTREFIIPMQLTPGIQHKVTTGSKQGVGRLQGFESADHVPAWPFTWSFTTSRPAAKPGPPPRVVSVTPPTDTEVAKATLVQVSFDRPMDPVSYGLKVEEPEPFEPTRKPSLVGQADYEPTKRRFNLVMTLPANWNGEVALHGFRGEDGGRLDGLRRACGT